MDGSFDTETPLASYDDAPQYGPTRDALPDGLTDAEWLAGGGRKGIAEDDPRRFGPPDGLELSGRIKLALWDSQCAAAPQGVDERADTPTVEVPQADVIAYLEQHDGNEVSRAMALAWERGE